MTLFHIEFPPIMASRYVNAEEEILDKIHLANTITSRFNEYTLMAIGFAALSALGIFSSDAEVFFGLSIIPMRAFSALMVGQLKNDILAKTGQINVQLRRNIEYDFNKSFRCFGLFGRKIRLYGKED